jgi:hypothetical protein
MLEVSPAAGFSTRAAHTLRWSAMLLREVTSRLLLRGNALTHIMRTDYAVNQDGSQEANASLECQRARGRTRGHQTGHQG